MPALLTAMQLDLSITLGDVLQIVVMMAALFMVYAAIRERLVIIETQLKPLWDEWVVRHAKD